MSRKEGEKKQKKVQRNKYEVINQMVRNPKPKKITFQTCVKEHRGKNIKGVEEVDLRFEGAPIGEVN